MNRVIPLSFMLKEGDDMTDYVYGFNGATLPGYDVVTRMKAAAAAGYDYYEPRVPALQDFAKDTDPTALRDKMVELGLNWLPLNALEDVIFPNDPDEFRRRKGELLNLADDFELETVIAVPAVSPPEVSDAEMLDKAKSDLISLIAECESVGLDVAFEMIGFPDRSFNSIPAARELVQELDITMIIDTFHLALSDASMEALRDLPPELIEVVHVSDALVSEEVEQVIDADRILPGEGGLPLDKYVSALLHAGFAGHFSVEVFHEKYGRRQPEEVAEESYRRVEKLIESNA